MESEYQRNFFISRSLQQCLINFRKNNSKLDDRIGANYFQPTFMRAEVQKYHKIWFVK